MLNRSFLFLLILFSLSSIAYSNTPLVKSLDKNQSARVEEFVEYSCKGIADKVKIFLDHVPLDVNASAENGFSALSCAYFYDRTEVLSLLLKDKRIDVNARSSNGKSPLSILLEKKDSKSDWNLRDLLKLREELNFQELAETDDMALHSLASRGYCQSMLALAQTSRADINHQNDAGQTPIMDLLVSPEWNCISSNINQERSAYRKLNINFSLMNNKGQRIRDLLKRFMGKDRFNMDDSRVGVFSALMFEQDFKQTQLVEYGPYTMRNPFVNNSLTLSAYVDCHGSSGRTPTVVFMNAPNWEVERFPLPDIGGIFYAHNYCRAFSENEYISFLAESNTLILRTYDFSYPDRRDFCVAYALPSKTPVRIPASECESLISQDSVNTKMVFNETSDFKNGNEVWGEYFLSGGNYKLYRYRHSYYPHDGSRYYRAGMETSGYGYVLSEKDAVTGEEYFYIVPSFGRDIYNYQNRFMLNFGYNHYLLEKNEYH